MEIQGEQSCRERERAEAEAWLARTAAGVRANFGRPEADWPVLMERIRAHLGAAVARAVAEADTPDLVRIVAGRVMEESYRVASLAGLTDGQASLYIAAIRGAIADGGG